MPLPQSGATHYDVQLGPHNKGRSIKGLVVCYVVWLGSMKGMDLRTYTSCISMVPCCGQDGCQAQVPQNPIKNNITYDFKHNLVMKI